MAEVIIYNYIYNQIQGDGNYSCLAHQTQKLLLQSQFWQITRSKTRNALEEAKHKNALD